MSEPAEAQSGTSLADREEESLWKSFKEDGSIAARQKLFSKHAVFARNIARRHYRERSFGDIELADLYQLAYAGLLEALDHFDPERGAPFRVYAAHRISGSVRDGIVQMSEMREQLSWHCRTRRERIQSLAELSQDSMSTSEAMASLAEIAVGLALGFMLEGTGLFSDGDDKRSADGVSSSAYDSVVWREVVARLVSELENLPDREQAILRQHYFAGANFDQLASLMNITKARISQLHRAALLLLQKRMSARGHFRLER